MCFALGTNAIALGANHLDIDKRSEVVDYDDDLTRIWCSRINSRTQHERRAIVEQGRSVGVWIDERVAGRSRAVTTSQLDLGHAVDLDA